VRGGRDCPLFSFHVTPLAVVPAANIYGDDKISQRQLLTPLPPGTASQVRSQLVQFHLNQRPNNRMHPTMKSENKGDIRGLVSDCLLCFNNCLNLTRSVQTDAEVLAELEAEQRRFRVWAGSLKVFSRPHVSLDAQLNSNSNREIKEMVFLLLQVLKENLSLGMLPSLPD